MLMPHPLLPVGLPPTRVSIAMNQMSQLSSLADMMVGSHTDDKKVIVSHANQPNKTLTMLMKCYPC